MFCITFFEIPEMKSSVWGLLSISGIHGLTVTLIVIISVYLSFLLWYKK